MVVRSRGGFQNGVIASRGGAVFTVSHGLAGDGAWVRLADGRLRFARLLRRRPDQDLAILQLPDDEEYPWLRVARAPEPGASISLLARSDRGGQLSSRRGELWLRGVELSAQDAKEGAQHSGRWRLADGLVHSIKLEAGHSGSALLDAEGRLIGINSAVAVLDRRDLSFALSATSYRDALAQDSGD